jgi:hypothetical protein
LGLKIGEDLICCDGYKDKNYHNFENVNLEPAQKSRKRK